MIPRICTLLLLVTACQLEPKYIGDPTGDSSSAAEESATDGASSEPINATEGYGSVGTSDSSSTGSDTDEVNTATGGGTSESSSTSGGTSESSSTSMGTVGTSESGSTSMGSATEGPSTTTTAGETEGAEVNCQESFLNFPEFDKLCEADDDCAIGLRTIDCCGTKAAIGIQIGDLEPFQQAEFMCLSTGDMCDCIPEATSTEDGKKQAEGDVIQVKCQDNLCVTSIQ